MWISYINTPEVVKKPESIVNSLIHKFQFFVCTIAPGLLKAYKVRNILPTQMVSYNCTYLIFVL